MGIQYLKKAVKTASTDDTKTRDIVQKLLSELEKSKEDGCKELTKKFEYIGFREIECFDIFDGIASIHIGKK